MGRELFDAEEVARQVFEQADAALGFSLSGLCFEGPEEELQLTANTQPAILAASIAAFRVLQSRGARPDVVAGHSLGEYSAHVAAGTLDLADALRLVRRRGELMQQAVPVGEGAMAAILGLDVETVEQVVANAQESLDDAVCEVANYNSPDQTVIAGSAAAVARARELAEAAGARRAIELPVSAPFHCSLMLPARQGLQPLLEQTRFQDPAVPVISNVDARPVTDGEAARDALARQIDGPVRWVESVRYMVGSMAVDRFAEVGPGVVLTGLIRRISDIRPVSVSSPAGVEKFLGG